MGSVWTYALISIALVALALSWRIERAWLWIGLGGASFFASTLFYDYAGYHGLHPVITLVCDAGIVIGTTGLVDMIGKNEHSALHPVYLHLHMPRSTHR